MATVEVSEFVATDATECECGEQSCYFCAVEYDAWLDEQCRHCLPDTWEVDWEAMGLTPPPPKE